MYLMHDIDILQPSLKCVRTRVRPPFCHSLCQPMPLRHHRVNNRDEAIDDETRNTREVKKTDMKDTPWDQQSGTFGRNIKPGLSNAIEIANDFGEDRNIRRRGDALLRPTRAQPDADTTPPKISNMPHAITSQDFDDIMEGRDDDV